MKAIYSTANGRFSDSALPLNEPRAWTAMGTKSKWLKGVARDILQVFPFAVLQGPIVVDAVLKLRGICRDGTLLCYGTGVLLYKRESPLAKEDFFLSKEDSSLILRRIPPY